MTKAESNDKTAERYMVCTEVGGWSVRDKTAPLCMNEGEMGVCPTLAKAQEIRDALNTANSSTPSDSSEADAPKDGAHEEPVESNSQISELRWQIDGLRKKHDAMASGLTGMIQEEGRKLADLKRRVDDARESRANIRGRLRTIEKNHETAVAAAPWDDGATDRGDRLPSLEENVLMPKEAAEEVEPQTAARCKFSGYGTPRRGPLCNISGGHVDVNDRLMLCKPETCLSFEPRDKKPDANGPICVDVIGQFHTGTTMQDAAADSRAKVSAACGRARRRMERAEGPIETSLIFNDLAVAVWDEAEAKGTHDALVGLGAEIEPGKEEQPQPKESDAVADAKRRVVAVGDGTFDDYAHRSHVAAEVVDDLVAAVQAADKTERVKYQNLVYECLRVLDGGRVHDGKGLTVDDLVGKVRELVAVRAADAKGKEVYWGVRGKDKEWEDFVGRRHEGRKGWKHPDGEYLKHRAHLWPDSGSAYAHSGPGDTIVPLVVEMVKEDG